MNNIEIIEKVIKKVEITGFILYQEFGIYYFDWREDTNCFIRDGYDGNGNYYIDNKISLKEVIFSHNFAKAFWGEKVGCSHLREVGNCKNCALDCLPCEAKKPAWQYRLQQMVLEEEPLKYLEKFLEN